MPSHYTAREFAIREERRLKRQQEATQLSLFPEVSSISHPMTERTVEINGHHWLYREWGNHAEHIQID